MNIDEHIARDRLLIAYIEQRIDWLDAHREQLDGLPDISNSCGHAVDFDNLSHQEVIRVIRAFGGKWHKQVNGERVDYCTSVDGMTIRCWRGEPPPSCRIVEVEEWVPAHAAKVRKLICPQIAKPAVAPEPVAIAIPQPLEPVSGGA